MIAGRARARWEEAAACTAVALVAAVVIMLTGIGVVIARGRDSVPAAPDVLAEPRAGRPSLRPPATAPPGDPVGVRIPAIGVAATLMPLGIGADGTLEVPPYELAGWYALGTRPGDVGPAVVAAHVDSTTGPAVFYRLKQLKPGEVVYVDYSDATVVFAVREARSFAKSRFPTDQVYGPTEGRELRLITCDGTFDRRARSYSSNLIVWADVVTPAA